MKIKFISLILIISLLQGFLFESFAQSDEGGSDSGSSSKISYGGAFGFTSTAFTNYEDTMFSDFGCGISIGAFGRYQINDMFFVSGELAYINRKTKNINQSIIFDTGSPLFSSEYIAETNTNIILHNVEGAIKINAYLPTGDRNFMPRVFIGSALGYIIKANAITERTFNYDYQSTLTKSDVTERFSNLDCSFIFGCGTDINMDIFDLTIDLDYKFGLSNINNVSGFVPFSSNTLELVIGAKF